MERLQSDNMAESIVAHYRQMAKAQAPKNDAGQLKRKIREVDRKIARMAGLM